MNINVIKSDGSKENLELGKIIRWSTWATQGCPDVSLENILTSGSIQFYDGITTDQITKSIAENCEVIAIIESQSNNFKLAAQYLTVAKNLYIPNIIKKASRTQSKNLTEEDIYSREYKISDINFIPLERYKIKSVLQNGINLGIYDPDLLDGTLSDSFFETVDSLLDYSRTNLLHYGGLRQLEAKYISRLGKELIEDPQQHFALIAVALVHSLSKADSNINLEDQIKDFTSYYNVFSLGKGNNPTPFSHNIRTNSKQYDSCLLFEIGDEIPSINEGMSTAMDATVAGAGVGVSLGAVRAKGTRYKSKGVHGGIGPYLQQLTSTVKGSNQETRGGGATVNLPLWHRDIYELLMVKDNTSGTEGENRWRHLDYAFHFSTNLVSRLASNEKILLISPHEKLPSGKTVYEAFYNVDENGKYNDKEYLEFEKSLLSDPDLFYINSSNVETAPLGKPVYTYAYDLFSVLAQQIMSTGRIYTFNVTHVNNHSSSLEPIKMSNLCLGLNTPVLTENGYVPIQDLEGEDVKVWNGKQWSETVFVKTSEKSDLYSVKFSDGSEVVTTDYHKWYIQNSNYLRRCNKTEMKRTLDLKVGDTLQKHSSNYVCNSTRVLSKAYTNGFYSGDGHFNTQKLKASAWIYTPKLDVLPFLECDYISSHSDKYQRTLVTFKDLQDKFYVPLGYSLKSQLEWFAGLLDADGTVSTVNSQDQIQLASISESFLLDVRLLLSEMGVVSKVTLNRLGTPRSFKKDEKEYDCKPLYRLTISGFFVTRLLSLGLNTHRLQFNSNSILSDRGPYVSVVSVTQVESGPTWCCTEPLENKFVVNGVLTGNCMEITQPTSAISAKYNSKEHKYELNNGEASFCQLGAVVLGNTAYEELEEVCKVLLNTQEAVFNISDYSSIPFSHKQKKRRNVGIGVVNLHYLLVKEVFSIYPEKEWIKKSGEVVHKYMEAIQYYLIKASVELAKKYGPCELFHTTKYSKGILPIDTCTNTSNNSYPLLKDWETLRTDVLTYGMRNCNLTASMPVESSSLPFGLINGKEKPRTPITYKGNKALMVAVAVPEIEKYGEHYLYAWDDRKVNKNKLDLVIESNYTKFQDQASSYNNYFDLVKNPKIDELEIFEILFAAPCREGIKTSYYANFNTDSEETENTKTETPTDIVTQLKQEALDEAAVAGCTSGMCKI